MACSSPIEVIGEDDEFDWEAAVREIDVACQNNQNPSTSLPSNSSSHFAPLVDSYLSGGNRKGSRDCKKNQPCKQSTLDKFITKAGLRSPTDNLTVEECAEDGAEMPFLCIDAEAAKTWIYPVNIPLRDYQFAITKTALFSNTLVALPTGLGKTLIAAVVMYNYFRWFPEGKIVFAAPSRPLVIQQIEACHNIVGIPQEWTIDLTGQVNPKKRAFFWKSKRVFFVTPQVLEKDIQSGTCPVKFLVCLVIDEAHRALGNYSYCVAVRELMATQLQLRILALTATPGSKHQAIQNIIDNLHISTLEYRNESDHDVIPYVHDRKIELIQVPLGQDVIEINNRLLEVIRPYVTRLYSFGLIHNRDYQTVRSFARLMSKNEDIRKAKLLMQQSLSHGAPSPKLSKMLEVLVEHFKTKDPQSSRVIIFSNFRGSVRDIMNALTHIGDLVKATEFIGQSSGKALKGQSQKVQQAVLEKFRAGGYNVIVATSIGEEGLDIMEVDLVVCFDANVSPLRMIQRMGRTGRKHDGRVVVLACEGSELKGYKRKQANSRAINKHLRNGGMNSFNFYSSPRMIPHCFKPEVQFIELSIEQFVPHGKKFKDKSASCLPLFRQKLSVEERNLIAKYFHPTGDVWRPSLIAFPHSQALPSKVHKVMHSYRTVTLIDSMQQLQGLTFPGDDNIIFPEDEQPSDQHLEVETAEQCGGDIKGTSKNKGKDEFLAPGLASPARFHNALESKPLSPEKSEQDIRYSSFCARMASVSFTNDGIETPNKKNHVASGMREWISTSLVATECQTPLGNLTNNSDSKNWCLSSGDKSQNGGQTRKLKRLRRIGDCGKNSTVKSMKENSADPVVNFARCFPGTRSLQPKYARGERKPLDDVRDFIDEEAERSLLSQSPMEREPNDSGTSSPDCVASMTRRNDGGSSLGKSSFSAHMPQMKSTDLSAKLNSESSYTNRERISSEARPCTASNLSREDESTIVNRKRKLSFCQSGLMPVINLEREFAIQSGTAITESLQQVEPNKIGADENAFADDDDDEFYESIDLDAMEAEATYLLRQKSDLSLGKQGVVTQPNPQNFDLQGSPSFDLGLW